MSSFLLGLAIFAGRLVDMTLNSFRVSFTIKRKKFFAACAGFLEATVWFLAVKSAMNTESKSMFIILGYALGFALGTFLGTLLSSKFDNGRICVKIITSDKNDALIEELKKNNFYLSIFDCHGAVREHYMIYIITTKKEFEEIKSIVERVDEKAFIIINDNKHVINGSFTSNAK